MGEYLQAIRKLRVTTPLGENELLLKSFSGSEGISTLFGYRLEMIAENRTKVTFDAILGQKLTVHLQLPDESSETHLNGLCVRLAQGGRDADFTTYEAEIVPDVWKLTRKAQSRIFQRMTVPEILKKVFQGYDVDWQLQGRYEPRDYCVQYRETDFNFGARLMEEEGIYFFFEHSDGSHKMIASDQATDHPTLPGDSKLIYEELEGGTRDENRVWSWRKEQEMRPGKYVLWDHCFELPHKHLEAETTILGSVPVGKETHKLTLPGVDEMELYDYPGEYAQRFDGIGRGGGEQADELQKIFHDNERTVGLRMDEETTPAIVIRARSNAKHVVSGYRFTLQRHFNADGDYVITSVRHHGSLAADYRSGKDEVLTYENEMTCIPAALPYRPRRTTPKPSVLGSQTAVVTGPAGEEIFTDKYGRVKVQFHWDREGKHDEGSSCWVRVGTSWAGRNWGAIRIPRIGHEVIVDFLEGDPDQPIVVGSVYNAEMMPPYELPKNRTQSGVKSRSSLGGMPKNYNELRFEDKKGKEEIHLHAERNYRVTVEADESRYVGHDRTTTIGHDCTTHVKNDLFLTVDNNRTTKIGANDDETVGNDQTITVGHDQKESIGNDETLTIGGKRSTTIGGCDYTKVGGRRAVEVIDGEMLCINGFRSDFVSEDENRRVLGAMDLTIGKGCTQTVGGSMNVTADNQMTLKASGILTIESGQQVIIKVGGSRVEVDRGGIFLKAVNVKVDAKGKATVEAPIVVVEGSGVVKVKGGVTNVEGAGVLRASGGVTMIG